ncbi:MAG: hypothetical protein ACTSQC_12490 [Candidatus Heimdallarchaeaceae archaeon]
MFNVKEKIGIKSIAKKWLALFILVTFLTSQNGIAFQASNFLYYAENEYSDISDEVSSNISWEKAEMLSNPSQGRAFDPMITIDRRKNIHCVWQMSNGAGLEIVYSQFSALKKQWSQPVIISANNPNILSVYPEIACDRNGVVHVIWRSSGPALNYRSLKMQ